MKKLFRKWFLGEAEWGFYKVTGWTSCVLVYTIRMTEGEAQEHSSFTGLLYGFIGH